MKKFNLLIIFLFIISLSFGAEPGTFIEAEGRGFTLEGRKDIAREKAIDDALRRALEISIGTYISSDSLITNGELISENILKSSSGYIKSYKIISENYVDKDETYIIKIKAEVFSGKIESSLKSLLENLGTPKVLSLVTGDPLFTSKINSNLIENGVEVVDFEQLKNLLDREKASSKNSLSAGLWFWTNFIVKGKTERIDNYDLKIGKTTVKSVTLKYSLDIIESSSAKIVKSFSDISTNTGGTSESALNKCIDELMAKLGTKLPNTLLSSITSKKTYTIIVKDIKDFEKKLEAVPGVKNISLTDKMGNETRYSLTYDNSGDFLISRLEEFNVTAERNNYIIYIYPKAVKSTNIKIEITNASFNSLKLIRDKYKNAEVKYSDKVISFEIPGNSFDIADALNKIGFEITTVEEFKITAKEGK